MQHTTVWKFHPLSFAFLWIHLFHSSPFLHLRKVSFIPMIQVAYPFFFFNLPLTLVFNISVLLLKPVLQWHVSLTITLSFSHVSLVSTFVFLSLLFSKIASQNGRMNAEEFKVLILFSKPESTVLGRDPAASCAEASTQPLLRFPFRISLNQGPKINHGKSQCHILTLISSCSDVKAFHISGSSFIPPDSTWFDPIFYAVQTIVHYTAPHKDDTSSSTCRSRSRSKSRRHPARQKDGKYAQRASSSHLPLPTSTIPFQPPPSD